MVSKSHAKRRQDIKTKLMAAIAMLLVSSIMMVSSTYAWFTLSTAPEVTGISTQVGANGNLEMALLPADAINNKVAKDANFGITSGSGDSVLADDLRNVTWGNLVDVSNNTFYGLDKISLYPSALNVMNGSLQSSLLRTPEYGSDGRVASLAENTVTGIYDRANGFPQDSNAWGVRAVGVSSAMTPRQLAYRNAISAANTAMSTAKSLASSSLNLNGSTLANIAVTHATNAAALHTAEEVTSLRNIVTSLTGTNPDAVDGVIEYIESAYKNYVLAWVASNANSAITDDQFVLVQAWIEANDIYTIAGSTTVDLGVGNTVTLTVPDAVKTPVNALATTKTDVTTANNMLDNLYTVDGGYPWNGSGDQKGIGDVLHILAETSAMKVNGIEVSKVKEDASINQLMQDVAGGKGVTVTMATGGGVYADIADHCGDYNASITMDISYNNLKFEGMSARMATASTLSPNNYLVAMGSQFGSGEGKFDVPSGGGAGSDMPITEYYGYVIDLAFRTNAAESNLLLQTEAVNRIYDENGSEETLGHGSTMTFTSTTPDFTAEQLAGLMEAIRVVFFNPTDNSVYAYAKLDMEQGKYTVTGGNTITAKLYIYETTAESYNPVPADTALVEGTDYYTKNGDGSYVKATVTLPATAPADTYYTKTEASENLLNGTDEQQVITALNQNTAKAVSVLVYLDGENIENADVAATAATSMTGTMNLQFASSANLVPMNYAPLMNQGGTTTNPDDEDEPTGN